MNYLLLVLLIWIQFSLWLGKNGVFEFVNIYYTAVLNEHISDIVKMKDRNNKLLLEIHNLVYGYELIEEHARYELGMIKSDEVFYKMEYDD